MVEGRHWDVFKMQVRTIILLTTVLCIFFLWQGQNKIWYAGVSASFESVRSVLSYNNRLLKQMIPQSSFQTISQQLLKQGSNSQSVTLNRKGTSTAITVNNCRYSCATFGGCEVNKISYILFSSYISPGSICRICS